MRAHNFALLLVLLISPGCAALSSLLGAAPAVVGAVGASVGAYERAVAADAAASGRPATDPAVLAELARARKLDAKVAADAKARDAEERKRVEKALAILTELQSRPACPTVDAGTDGGR